MSWASCLAGSGLADWAGSLVAQNSRATNRGTTQVFLAVSMGGDCFTVGACGATWIAQLFAAKHAVSDVYAGQSEPGPSRGIGTGDLRTGWPLLRVCASASWYRSVALLATPTTGRSLTGSGWSAGDSRCASARGISSRVHR